MNTAVLALAVTAVLTGQDAELQHDPDLPTGIGSSLVEVAEYDGSAGQLSVPNPWRAEQSIRIDGIVEDAEWGDEPLLRGFTQFEPVEGIPATQRTEVRVAITDDAILFAVKAFDDDIGGIRATLGERDSFSRTDDYVRFILDTFDDKRRGYVIMVNPLGVQQDGLWLQGGGGRRGGFGAPIDWNPDFIWESSGQIHEWGYSAEIKVPFKSLRFPEAAAQDWGLQVERHIRRNGYEESWAPVSGNVANKLEQFGRLTDLRDLDPGLFFEVNPVQTLGKQGSFDDAVGSFERGAVTGDFGLNMTYGITSNLTLDGTYNPDFSQVEADAGQIAVNERFALFFQEKRPFFLEGTEIFNMPKQLVYTRSIGNPVAGAKLTGKVGGFNMGYLGAVDEIADANQPDGRANPVVNLFRVRRDLGTSSNIGLVYTDRTSDSDVFNRLIGFDGRFLFNRRYTVTLMGAGSLTGTGADAENLRGSMVSARLDRSGRNFSYSFEIEDVAPDFRAGSGFIRRLGETQIEGNMGYNFRGSPGDLIERWGPRFQARTYWDHDDFWDGKGLQEAEVELNTSVSFRNNITLWATHQRSFFDFPADAYGGLEVALPGGGSEPFVADQSLFRALPSTSLFIMVSPWDRIRGNVRGSKSQTPLFDFRTGTPVDLADSWSGNVSLDLFPTKHLGGEIGVRYTRLTRSLDGSLYSEATIPRVKAQYQFTRALFFRTIFEYGSQLRGELRDPVTGQAISYCGSSSCSAISGSESNDFSVETLLSYEPTPGTVFFMGYGRQMEDTGSFRFRDVRAQADGFFVKLSYRFRM